MARPKSERVKRVKNELLERLNAGFFRPGNHFCSNRELTRRYGVSYQTAHRIIQELQDEGCLHRVPRSGTYVANTSDDLEGVALVFHPNIVDDNFGGILLRRLKERFTEEGIPYKHVSSTSFDGYVEGMYNIIWAQKYDLRRIPTLLHYSLMLDGEPEEGLNATFTDCVSIDYRLVGITCGDLLKEKFGASKVAVLAGEEYESGPCPTLIEGFCEVFPECQVFYQKDWDYETALEAAEGLRGKSFNGFLALGDSGAQALRTVFGDEVPVVAHGNAERLHAVGVEGVAIPWEQIVDEVVRLYRMRSESDIGVGHRFIIAPKSMEEA